MDEPTVFPKGAGNWLARPVDRVVGLYTPAPAVAGAAAPGARVYLPIPVWTIAAVS